VLCCQTPPRDTRDCAREDDRVKSKRRNLSDVSINDRISCRLSVQLCESLESWSSPVERIDRCSFPLDMPVCETFRMKIAIRRTSCTYYFKRRVSKQSRVLYIKSKNEGLGFGFGFRIQVRNSSMRSNSAAAALQAQAQAQAHQNCIYPLQPLRIESAGGDEHKRGSRDLTDIRCFVGDD
jgi:hypothetical protein